MFLSVHVPEHSKQYTSQHKRKWEMHLTAGSHMLINMLRFAARSKHCAKDSLQRGRSSEVYSNIHLVIFWTLSRTFQNCRTCENSFHVYFPSLFLLCIETTSVRYRPNNACLTPATKRSHSQITSLPNISDEAE